MSNSSDEDGATLTKRDAEQITKFIRNLDSSHLLRGYFIGCRLRQFAYQNDGFTSRQLRDELDKYEFETPHANSLLFLMQGMADMGVLELDGRTWYPGDLETPEFDINGNLSIPESTKDSNTDSNGD